MATLTTLPETGRREFSKVLILLLVQRQRLRPLGLPARLHLHFVRKLGQPDESHFVANCVFDLSCRAPAVRRFGEDRHLPPAGC